LAAVKLASASALRPVIKLSSVGADAGLMSSKSCFMGKSAIFSLIRIAIETIA
jgi:hypothetical protein